MLQIALQVIVGLVILNVWLLRRSSSTPFRGGNARNMREEFEAYGLPCPVMWVVGTVKVALAFALLAAIWLPLLVRPAAAGMAALMLGAFVMHLKVRDPIKKALPSLVILAMCVVIFWIGGSPTSP